MAKTNIEQIKEYYKGMGFKVVSCDIDINKISKAELKNVIANLWEESTDFITKIRGKHFVIEVYIPVDENNVYIKLRTLKNYSNQYGEMVLIELLERFGLDELYENNELKY